MATLKYKNKDGEYVPLSTYAVNSPLVVQDTGDSTTAVMSLNAVTLVVLNLPDNEDLIIERDKLKLADRNYSVDNYSGKGYKILRKNILKIYDLEKIVEYAEISFGVANSSWEISEEILEGDVDDVALSYPGTPIKLYGVKNSEKKLYKNWTGQKFPVDNYLLNGEAIEGKIYKRKNLYQIYIGVKGNLVEYTEELGAPMKSVNLLTQDMINDTNTIYEVRYDFIFLPGRLTLKHNSSLINKGGSITLIDSTYGSIDGNVGDVPIYNSNSYNYTIIKNPLCTFINKENIIYPQIFLSDFIDDTDIITKSGVRYINLNSAYNKCTKFLSKNGTVPLSIIINKIYSNYLLVEPLILLEKVLLDFLDNSVTILSDFSGNCLFKTEYANNGASKYGMGIRNLNIILPINLTSLENVFDFKFFPNIMENIYVNCSSNNVTVLKTYYGDFKLTTYADLRKIVNFRVTGNSRPKTEYTAYLFSGDGCIIEQSYLGHVLIAYGRPYTIIGNLNDRYTLYNTAVNFIGNHWEIGLVNIFNSRVNFINNTLSFGIRDSEKVGYKINIDDKDMFPILVSDISKLLIPSDLPNLESRNTYLYNGYSTVTIDELCWIDPYYWGYLNPDGGDWLRCSDTTRLDIRNNILRTPNLSPNKFVITYEVLPNGLIPYNLIDNIETINVNSYTYNLSSGNVSNPVDLGVDFNNEAINICPTISFNIQRLLFNKLLNYSDSLEYGKYPNYKMNVNTKDIKTVLPIMIFYKINDFKGYECKKIKSVVENVGHNFDMTKILTLNDDGTINISLSYALTKSRLGKGKYKTEFYNLIEDSSLYDAVDNELYNECIKVEKLSDSNLRAYLNLLPQYGLWNKNDEVVIKDNIYIYDGSEWRNKDGTLVNKVTII